MQIVVPAETWANERRVALIPDSVKKLTRAGLSVSVESGLGLAVGIQRRTTIRRQVQLFPVIAMD